MGRKRKALVSGGAMAADGEVKTSKEYPETTIPEDKNVQPDANGQPALKEKSEVTSECLRRSGRLKHILSPSRIQVENPVVEHVNLNGKGKEGEATLPEEKNLEVETRVDPVSCPPQSELKELSLEEKVDYLVKTVNEFKPKVFGRSYEGSSSDLNYKSLYIDAQKKYEDLMEEHYEICRKLEFAHGQIAAYEKMKDVTGGGSRGVILLSDLVNVTTGANANVNSSSLEKVHDCMPSPPAVTAVDDDDPKPMRKCRRKKNDSMPSPTAATAVVGDDNPKPMNVYRKKKNDK